MQSTVQLIEAKILEGTNYGIVAKARGYLAKAPTLAANKRCRSIPLSKRRSGC